MRPIYHRKPERVRAHVFVCMLAYYVEWHLRRAWAPLLFEDHDKEAAKALRRTPVTKAKRSPAAQRKASTKRDASHVPVHSLRTLLDDLATLVCNRVRPPSAPEASFDMATIPTPIQRRALDALEVSPTP